VVAQGIVEDKLKTSSTSIGECFPRRVIAHLVQEDRSQPDTTLLNGSSLKSYVRGAAAPVFSGREYGTPRSLEEVMKVAQIAPLYESVPPTFYGGTERVVSYLTDELSGTKAPGTALSGITRRGAVSRGRLSTVATMRRTMSAAMK